MPLPASGAEPTRTLSRAARRAAIALAIAAVATLPLLLLWKSSAWSLLFCAATLALAAMAAFALFEAWPRRLPRWLERWALQVVAVGVTVTVAAFVMHLAVALPGGAHDWLLLGFTAILVAPWSALVAIVRQKEAFVRHQELAFALERSELERQALDARLHLLQAQVAPHFLFNTLANVQALVEAGSPQASALLRSLVEYLRGAVPLLHDEPAATIEREVGLVRPYLELMHMRMPDRLRYALHVDPAALALRCPPTTLLTLVENAVRHGIDPSEEGGTIDVAVERRGERCLIRVTDTGAGLGRAAAGIGTGLASLRERLRLVFGEAAELRLVPRSPGAVVEVDMPART